MNVSIRVVSQDEAEIRLDRWFRRHFPAMTQGVIQKLCRTGQVRVDGHRIEAATRLQPGQTVRIPPMKPVEARAIAMPDDGTRDELERMVLYRDAQLIVLNKPFGLPVQGGPGISRHLDGMLDGLRFGHPDRPRLVHRLDRDTSGVLVLARSPGVAARIAASFRGRDVEKTYWAVVAGRPVPVAGRVEADLVRIGGKRGERAMVAEPGDPEAAHAITDYRTLDHAARRLAWLELRPLTGRTHQLRVHCMSLGTPILGDEKYGIERNTDERGARDIAFIDGLSDQLHLHARGIRLPHPEGGMLEVEAELPPHMRETFATVGFEAGVPAPPVRVTH
jgi:23S rRNA pseudouridine955/2504/2580 synthase